MARGRIGMVVGKWCAYYDQLWDESICPDFEHQMTDTSRYFGNKWMSHGWDYVDVKPQLLSAARGRGRQFHA